MPKFYITTAIDYPSAPPHIGHVYEKVCADVIARWHRNIGDDVFFSTGTDEHGQKMQRSALKSNEEPEKFAQRMSKKFIDLWGKLNITYDDFIRTTQNQHTEIVQAICKKIYEKGDIYKGLYEGLYCVDCETFYLEKDLKEGFCPIHNKKVEMIKEESYFFKMSKYQERILKHIENNKDFIQPQTRRNEIINRIKEGIRDLSISRSNSVWGIPFPTDKKHVIFVWLDALLNYISVIDYPKKKFRKYWPADVHLIGKDILWFHAVVWLAVLLAVDIELPRKIFVHGFINIRGEKISKSKGIMIDPVGLINRYGPDALRYFLLREIPFGKDGDFSEDALIRRINSDLANDLGNLVNRTLTMVQKYFGGKIPKSNIKRPASGIIIKTKSLPKVLQNSMAELNFNQALISIWELVNTANKHIEETAPWKLSKEGRFKELSGFIYELMESLRITALSIYPFMPATAENIWRQLGLKSFHKSRFSDIQKWGCIKTGTRIKKGNPLFPRIKERK